MKSAAWRPETASPRTLEAYLAEHPLVWKWHPHVDASGLHRYSRRAFYEVVSRTGLVLDDIKLRNCAGCSTEILGQSMGPWYRGLPEADQERCPPLIAGRAFGRPYCPECWGRYFRTHRVPEAN